MSDMGQTLTWLVDLFERGGFVMWGISALSVYATALAIDRWITYGRNDKILVSAWKTVSPLDSFSEKQLDSLDPNDMTGRLARVVYERRNLAIDERTQRVRNVFLEESAGVEKHLDGISVSATILPMLGLLGTVIGMIMAFDAIALRGAGDPKIVAGGISQALITTASGLMTSIPLIYMHSALTSRADRLIRRLDEFVTHLLHISQNNNV